MGAWDLSFGLVTMIKSRGKLHHHLFVCVCVVVCGDFLVSPLSDGKVDGGRAGKVDDG